MDKLLNEIRHCSVCKEHLPYAPRPIIQASRAAKVVVIGQAPGLKVQQSGIPWDDASGDNLRSWLGIDRETFYNDKLLTLMPMGFCYPGTGKSGDLPPRPECAPLWHQPVIASMPEVQLTLLIGQYAQPHYLKERCMSTLTETVKNYQAYLPEYLPLPHPSPRNNIWQKKNSWFREEVLPTLQSIILPLLEKDDY
ncbi:MULTISPECIES: uracil-DNA glycosylase family protein [unclassified Imperialibacter]|uniref:uracil-DNA glycosylase family protein n=1 Tax=unclassified Imperialibacter TaxID=2629706 RepID=UPI0012524924|nr:MULTISPECIES: uracil-DNA glycosylase family protein [unclassified Imperialibacter]CAD5251209.1 IclR family transcriptional regulator [Imperialibacter sp. 89]CAD5284207.1 IclR family transcriptional regulator [Imperialibacter sp. 75]VVT11000.1 IclR family transcriptional regulator [Imperialibacter sp. EC-SDR9]